MRRLLLSLVVVFAAILILPRMCMRKPPLPES